MTQYRIEADKKTPPSLDKTLYRIALMQHPVAHTVLGFTIVELSGSSGMFGREIVQVICNIDGGISAHEVTAFDHSGKAITTHRYEANDRGIITTSTNAAVRPGDQLALTDDAKIVGTTPAIASAAFRF